MSKHEELKALVKGMNKADRVGAHEYFVNRFGVGSVGPVEEYLRRPNGFWEVITLEQMIEIARPYTGRKNFSENDGSSYSVAVKNGWMDNIADALGWKIKTRDFSDITLDQMIDLARPFGGRTEFFKGDAGAYCVARQRDWMDDIADALGWKGYRTVAKMPVEELIERAKPFNSRVAFQKGDPNGYSAARKKKCVDEVARALGWERLHKDWSDTTLEQMIEIARPYTGRWDFEQGESSARHIVRQRGWMDDIANALGWERQKKDWSNTTLEQMIEIARPFDKRKAFEQANSAAYQAATRYNMLDDVAEALGWEARPDWSAVTFEQVLEMARPYTSRTDFHRGSRPGYRLAHKHNWINDISDALGWVGRSARPAHRQRR